MKRLMTLICLLVLVGGCILVIGCGNGNGKVAGIYTNLYGDTLALKNDGSFTEEMLPIMHLEGAIYHGSFSYNGKEIKIKTLAKHPKNNWVEIWQVAGNTLLDPMGTLWTKQ